MADAVSPFEGLADEPQYFWMNDKKINLHASAIKIDKTILLVVGASGAGKSHLCQELIDWAKQQGKKAQWIADDRLILSNDGNKFAFSAPQNLKGLAEASGGIAVICDVWQGETAPDDIIWVQLSTVTGPHKAKVFGHDLSFLNLPAQPQMDQISKLLTLLS